MTGRNVGRLHAAHECLSLQGISQYLLPNFCDSSHAKMADVTPTKLVRKPFFGGAIAIDIPTNFMDVR
jgi:hypothetical protein